MSGISIDNFKTCVSRNLISEAPEDFVEIANCLSPPAGDLLQACEIETRTEGEDRRVLARARLREIEKDTFEIIPFYMREIGGARVQWSRPARDCPIDVGYPIVGFDQACSIFQWWATCTFAENATRYR